MDQKAASFALAEAVATAKAKDKEEEEEEKAVAMKMAMTWGDNSKGSITAELMTETTDLAGAVTGRGEVTGDKGEGGDRVSPLGRIGAATATPQKRKKRLSRAGPSSCGGR